MASVAARPTANSVSYHNHYCTRLHEQVSNPHDNFGASCFSVCIRNCCSNANWSPELSSCLQGYGSEDSSSVKLSDLSWLTQSPWRLHLRRCMWCLITYWKKFCTGLYDPRFSSSCKIALPHLCDSFLNHSFVFAGSCISFRDLNFLQLSFKYRISAFIHWATLSECDHSSHFQVSNVFDCHSGDEGCTDKYLKSKSHEDQTDEDPSDATSLDTETSVVIKTRFAMY